MRYPRSTDKESKGVRSPSMKRDHVSLGHQAAAAAVVVTVVAVAAAATAVAGVAVMAEVAVMAASGAATNPVSLEICGKAVTSVTAFLFRLRLFAPRGAN